MKQKLIEWANKYEVASFIANDPVQFPRKHIGKRAEISGFITSWLSSAIVRQSSRRLTGWIRTFAMTPIAG